MKSFFTTFTLTILLIIELLVGTVGVFYPITALGIFYFCQLNNRVINLILAIGIGVILDLFLLNRSYCLNVIIYLAIVFWSEKHQSFLGRGLLINSFAGSIIFFFSNLIFFTVFMIKSGKLISNIEIIFSLSFFSMIVGYISMMLLIMINDFIAKKLKISGFLRENISSGVTNRYRRMVR